MRLLKTVLVGLTVALSIGACAQQKTGIAAVADAMGATNLNSIEYSGSGELFGFGQAFVPGERWPRFIQRSYNVAINYQRRMREHRAQPGRIPPRGGGRRSAPISARLRRQRQVGVERRRRAAGGHLGAVDDRCGTVGDAARRDQGGDGQWRHARRQHHYVQAADREYKATLNDQNAGEKVSYLSTNSRRRFEDEIAYSDYADFNGVSSRRTSSSRKRAFPFSTSRSRT